jgi:segregation and condensation protein A
VEQETNNVEDIDFVKFIENPTWKDVLMGLINSEKIDPWNIDVSEITSKYLEVIMKMKNLDLHLPANLILAASILVRIKSDDLIFKEQDNLYDYGMDGIPEELMFSAGDINNSDSTNFELSYRQKLPRMRRVTLGELMGAVEEAIKEEGKREIKFKEKTIREKFVMPIKIDRKKVDVEKIIKNTYSKITEKTDEYGMVSFNNITKNENKDKIYSMIAILYLETHEYITIVQETFFGEIIIKQNGNKELNNLKINI